MNAAGEAPGSAGGQPPASPRVPGLVMLRRLGAGGHGEVWLAADLASSERVAVKVRRGVGSGGSGGSGSGGDGAGQLAREIALLRRIDHPHVVPLRRVVDLPDGGRALVMGLAGGGSLADLVAGRGPLDAPEACTVIVPLARTLAELHARGLVHGDLSPGNVLFTANGRPMIADLGCAVVLGERPTQAWGTDGYGDPGRCGPPGAADDVYALGALLRFALSGVDPGAPSAAAGGSASVDGGPAGTDPRADGLLALADLCTAPDPGRRPDPDAVARTALAAAPPAPVRLLRPAVRPAAAQQGWTRPAASPDAPTAGTALPPTSFDLAIGAAVRGLPWQGSKPGARDAPVDANVSANADADPGQAVTRRRSLPVPDAVAASQGRRGERRGREPRRPQHELANKQRGPSEPRARSIVRPAAIAGGLAVCAVASWLWLFPGGRGTGAIRTAPSASQGPPASQPRVSQPRAPRSPSPSRATPAPAREPVEVAVARLAAGRAAAFGAASVAPLSLIDEPGSPALAADTALVGRLNDLGLRLEGLTFRVMSARRVRGDAEAITVEADVATSAHRQVAVPGGAVRAAVPAEAVRRVVLTLAPSPDGRHWLVRSVT